MKCKRCCLGTVQSIQLSNYKGFLSKEMLYFDQGYQVNRGYFKQSFLPQQGNNARSYNVHNSSPQRSARPITALALPTLQGHPKESDSVGSIVFPLPVQPWVVRSAISQSERVF